MNKACKGVTCNTNLSLNKIKTTPVSFLKQVLTTLGNESVLYVVVVVVVLYCITGESLVPGRLITYDQGMSGRNTGTVQHVRLSCCRFFF